MDKRWRNLIVLIIIVLVVLIVYFSLNNPSTSIPGVVNASALVDDAFAKNKYSKEVFFSESYVDTPHEKLLRLHSSLASIDVDNFDDNSAALVVYYKLSAELKLLEIYTMQNVQKYSLEQSSIDCAYIDEIGETDLNMQLMNSKYEGISALKQEYLQGSVVGSFDSQRFVLIPSSYSNFYNNLFALCTSMSAVLEESE